MALRLEVVDGRRVVYADSPEELAQFWNSLDGQAPLPSKASETGQNARPKPSRGLPDRGKRLVRLLLEHPDGVPTSQVAEHLGIEAAKGVGPTIVSVVKWAGEMNFLKREVIMKFRRRHNGEPTRFLRLGERLARYLRDRGMRDLED